MASQFGLSKELDTFLFALVLVSYPSSVIMCSLQGAFIPIFVKSEHSKDYDRSQYLLETTYTIANILILSSLFVWLVGLFTLDYFGIGITGNYVFQDLMGLVLLLIPWVLVNSIYLISYGVLQSQKQFVIHTLIPVVFIITILVVLYLSQIGNSKILIVSYWIGVIIEFICLNLFLKKLG
ncbi:hypothetical protein MJH12_19665, partial [bacterium]|nr:hypothetical protein [bacterium]